MRTDDVAGSLPDQPEVERQAYCVPEFAKAFGFSRAHFYNLLKDGKGPRVMRAGRRTLISKQAAEDWRASLEQPEAA